MLLSRPINPVSFSLIRFFLFPLDISPANDTFNHHSYGDSDEAISTGHIDFAPISPWDCTNGSTITASGSVDFDMTCSWDAGNNATCVIPANETVVIPVLSYTIS